MLDKQMTETYEYKNKQKNPAKWVVQPASAVCIKDNLYS